MWKKTIKCRKKVKENEDKMLKSERKRGEDADMQKKTKKCRVKEKKKEIYKKRQKT